MSVGAGYAAAPSRFVPNHGALLDVAASLGLGPELSVRGRASYAFHPEHEPMHLGLVAGELLYLVDVLEVVPYAGLGLGGLGRSRAGHGDLDAAVHAVFGADYLVSREVALGLDFRTHLVFTDLDRAPWLFALTASAIFLFDQ